MNSYRRHLRLKFLILATLLTNTIACTTQSAVKSANQDPALEPMQQELLVGERFIDAFYSWQPQALVQITQASADQDRVLYYQAWAEAGNYKIKNRRPCVMSGRRVSCAITVTDNIGATLGYIATDTFLLKIETNQVVAIEFTSDDPPIFEALFKWMAQDRPQVFSGACKDMFDGGKTPVECIRAVVSAAQDFKQTP